MSLIRSRWAALGAAVAVTLGAGGFAGVHAAISSGERTVFVPISPCRLMDTRPAADNVGPRASPIGPGETYPVTVHGANGRCDVPVDAVGVSLNVTALDATQSTFLTLWPSDSVKPLASSLNPAPGQGPVPNSVVTDLSADGRFSVFNLAGTVNVLADVVGYYVDHNHDDRYYTRSELYTRDELYARGELYTRDEVEALVVGAVGEQLSLGAAAFVPRDLTTTTYRHGSGNQLYVPSGVGDTFVAQVSLPDGATIESMRTFVWDNAAANISVVLFRIPHADPTFMTVLNVLSSGAAASVVTLVDDTVGIPAFAVVDNANYSYVAWVDVSGADWSTHGLNLRFQGLVIDYAPKLP